MSSPQTPQRTPDGRPILPLAAGEHPPVQGAVKLASTDMSAHHSARTKARKAALDALFQADLLGADPLEVLDAAALADQLEVRDFTREIVQGVRYHGDELDQQITDAGNWDLGRMARIDRNLARIAAWEIGYTDINPAAAISEAVGLADELSTDDSARFLNGLLSQLVSRRRSAQA